MRSMTGFGVGEASLSPPDTTEGAPRTCPTKVAVEIRSVNHRFLDVRVRVPSQVPDLAMTLEGLARERLTRGRFDVSVRIEGASVGAFVLDRARARSIFQMLRDLRDELAPGSDVPLGLLANAPDLFVPSIDRQLDEIRGALAIAFEAAVRSLDRMREREGLALGEDLSRRLETIRRLAALIAERSPVVIESYKKRVKDRAERLRASTELEVDPVRLEQEIAMFADRIDIAEELTRLDSHTAHFASLVVGGDAVGRRLDFLLQEMAREANTIGSKGQDVTIAHAVVDLKAEIERMREQVQNIE